MYPVLVAGLAGTLILLGSSGSQPQRTVEQRVHSAANPALTVRVDPSLPYLGRVELDVRGVAVAEQFYFAKIAGGKLGPTVVVHFEHFLPDNDRTFGYPTFRMTTLGSHEYLHQQWPAAEFEMFGLEPVKQMLASRGVTAEASWLINRYARVVDEAGKHELLLFYLEPGSASPVPIETLAAEAHPSGVPQTAGAWMTVATGLAERAQKLITVQDREQTR